MYYTLRSNEIIQGGRKQLMIVLWKGDVQVLTIVYDLSLHTARLESQQIRRVFMIYEEGKRQAKTVFKNEYGFDIGVIDRSLNNGEYGFIQIYNSFYYYNLSSHAKGVLSISQSPGTETLLNIAIETSSSGIVPVSSLPVTNAHFNCILLGISWYLQLEVTDKEILKNSLLSPANPTQTPYYNR